MADQITDNRILISNANSTTGWVDLAGTAGGNLDSPPQIFIEGGASIGEIISSTRNGLLFNMGSAQDWSNNTFYIWINCGIVGLLDLKASGGFTIRFAGTTVGNYFEFNVGGSDSWPIAVSGGWVMFVIDIEATPSATNLPPATSAIQYVGWTGITATIMTKMVDNTWIDALWRLPKGEPAIIVEGRLNGITPWSWTEVVSASEAGAWGVSKTTTGGAIALNGPIQFFIDDASTNAFIDTNSQLLWENQEWVASDLYGLIISGSSAGTAEFTLGVKTGIGDDATGAQGNIFSAALAGVRWFISASSFDMDSCSFNGCTFIHGAEFHLNNPIVETISTIFLDSTKVNVSSSLFLKNSTIDADTLDNVAFLFTDDLTNSVVRSTFQFSDGHAIELTAPVVTSQTSKGNIFVGYGADDSTDAAITNNTGGNITMSITDAGTDPTVETLANTQTLAQVSVTLSGMTSGSEVIVLDAGTGATIASVENVGPTGIFVFQDDAANVVDIFIHAIDYVWQSIDNFTIPALDTELPIQQQFDRNYKNPP